MGAVRINEIVLVMFLKLSERNGYGETPGVILLGVLAFSLLLSFHLFCSHVALDNKAKSYIKLEAHPVGVIIFMCQNGGVSLLLLMFQLPSIAKKSHRLDW